MARALPGPPPALRAAPSLTLRFALAGGVSLLAWVLLQVLASPPLSHGRQP